VVGASGAGLVVSELADAAPGYDAAFSVEGEGLGGCSADVAGVVRLVDGADVAGFDEVAGDAGAGQGVAVADQAAEVRVAFL
jgi:hypothetical protein